MKEEGGTRMDTAIYMAVIVAHYEKTAVMEE